MRKDINIVEVAKKANVSIATVSRVFNNSGKVKESTRRKIEQIIEETGYYPNILARELAEKKTSLIGMIVHNMTGEGMPRAINGVSEVLIKRGYNLLIACTNGVFENEQKHFEIFRSKRVDGIIFATDKFLTAHEKMIKKLPIPVLSLLQVTEKENIPFVSFDNYRFAKEATQKLIELGHSKICFIGGPESSVNGLERFRGFTDALKEAGIKINKDLIINGNFHVEDSYHKMKVILDRNRDFTAVITINDGMAIGAINCLEKHNILVPDQVSVLGLDLTVLASTSRLKLSGVHYSYKTLGKKGAEILLNLIESEDTLFDKYIVPYDIYLRESVSCRSKSFKP